MNVQHKLLENGITQLLIHNESHSLLRPLAEDLRVNPNVTFVSYIEVHPLKNEMKLLIKSKNEDEMQLVIETIDNLLNDLEYSKDMINAQIGAI